MKELRWSRTMTTSPRAVRKISHSSRPAEQGLVAFPNWLLEKSGVGAPLTLRHPWLHWTRFRVGWVFSSLAVCLRHKSRIAARVAGPVIILSALPGFASAQDATWSPSTPDFNTPTNWTPATVPTGTATFNNSGTKALTFSQDTTVDAMQFNAPNYMFELTKSLTQKPRRAKRLMANWIAARVTKAARVWARFS